MIPPSILKLAKNIIKEIRLELYTEKNDCRNPFGLFHEPSCVTEFNKKALTPCEIPDCRRKVRGKPCLMTPHGTEFKVMSCPTFKKYWPTGPCAIRNQIEGVTYPTNIQMN